MLLVRGQGMLCYCFCTATLCPFIIIEELWHAQSTRNRAPWELKTIWLSMCLRNCGSHVTIHPSAHLSPPQLTVQPRSKRLGTLEEIRHKLKMHFAKLTHILPLKKAWGCCYKGLFLLSPSPPSSVDRVELKLECITSTLHWRGRGEGRCLNLRSYCVSVPRVLTRVVVLKSHRVLSRVTVGIDS